MNIYEVSFDMLLRHDAGVDGA